jgi:hypothetical protein
MKSVNPQPHAPISCGKDCRADNHMCVSEHNNIGIDALAFVSVAVIQALGEDQTGFGRFFGQNSQN